MMKIKNLVPVSLLIGVVFDLLFWEKAPGISFPIFTLLCLFSGFLLIKATGKNPEKTNWLLMASALVFSAMTFLRGEPFTRFTGFSLSLLSMALLASSYLSARWMNFNLVDHITNLFRLAGGMVSLPWSQKSESRESKMAGNKKPSLKAILRGIAISLPIWLVFVGLLYSADLIFAQRIDSLTAFLNLENLSELAMQLVLALLTAYFFSGAILFAAQKSDQPSTTGTGKPVVPPFLGLTEASILLSGVILLFASFVGIQFQYFFSGQTNISLEGFTYAEYARRGFGELVGVAALSIMLLKGLSVATRRVTNAQQRIFSALSSGQVALVLVILVSAFQRLSLYESAYGFTRLRAYSHILIIWLGIFLLVYLMMEFFKRQSQFINVSLLVMAGFSLTLGVLGIDAFIARKNIERSLQGEPLDAAYLAGLSSDAVPTMVGMFSEKLLPEDSREGLGAALVCFQQMHKKQMSDDRPWQSFHLAEQSAKNALKKVNGELKLYKVNDQEWPVVVTSPRGIWFACTKFTGID